MPEIIWDCKAFKKNYKTSMVSAQEIDPLETGADEYERKDGIFRNNHPSEG